MKLPLEGLTVLEFSQYLAGPYAGLRLADLGARVIKVERPKWGDACRQLATKNMWADGDSVLFHTINRNKESFAANLKDPEDLARVKKLVAQADVLTHNFRPGIMDRIGLDYDTVKAINPGIVYAEVSGYGKVGTWRDKPGQDLLAQSFSGLVWHSGEGDQPPVPFGVAVADMMCGTHLAQGILAALVRKKRSGVGAKVEVSLLESILDMQFEGLTAHLNLDNQTPKRSLSNNAHPYLGAPYGVYQTADGFIAIAMGCMKKLADALEYPALAAFEDQDRCFAERDEIKQLLADYLIEQPTRYWLDRLTKVDFWASEVLNYQQLTSSEAYKALDMELSATRKPGVAITTTRCPIRLNGQALKSEKGAPALGSGNAVIEKEFGL
ncbi:CaiB/BaiF CoA transferase family protein [Aliagarivorans taiwanensis]|uniref:CaiB/BaiF CoA transferase family protein n=1 Tax=Aliagarivorans taiwanensis TaxID=561966 RepID=UPI0004276A13|nr:CaiB/BaiF CoA-transferase family protein [Aliagarivorans taiwanensis]